MLPSYLFMSSPLFSQSKQEAEGLGCDVVRVEVDESLTKEQLLETFIDCGSRAHAHARLHSAPTMLPAVHESLCQVSWFRRQRRQAAPLAAWWCCWRGWRRRLRSQACWGTSATAWTPETLPRRSSSTLVRWHTVGLWGAQAWR